MDDAVSVITTDKTRSNQICVLFKNSGNCFILQQIVWVPCEQNCFDNRIIVGVLSTLVCSSYLWKWSPV